MKKRLLLSSFAICAMLLQADFQASAWKFRRPLSVNTAAPLNVLNIERSVYTRSQPDLADLRVFAQEEVPYVLEKMSGEHRLVEVSSGSLDQGVTPSGDLELTVDAGSDHRHNGIRLTTPRTNFRQRVSVATSDDAHRWTRVRDDGYIFDFSQDDRQVSVLSVDYPESTRRYVRLTIYGWKDPKAVTGCFITLEENQPPVRDTMASLKPEPQQDAKTQSTLYTWDLGAVGVPHDRLSLVVDTPAFQRAAAIESSDDGSNWSSSGLGVLSRYRKEQSLDLDFPESHQRYLRLRIYNRDDRPLSVKSAGLSVIRTRLKFKTGTAAHTGCITATPKRARHRMTSAIFLPARLPVPSRRLPREPKNPIPLTAKSCRRRGLGASSIPASSTSLWRWP